MRDLKVPILIIAFATVVLLGLGARGAYYKTRVVSPLETALNAVPGVLEVDVASPRPKSGDIVVTLSGDVALEQTYATIRELVTSTLGERSGSLTIRDARTPRLTDAYHAIHFFIQEGMSTGLYAHMAQNIHATLEEHALRHRIFVADDYVFVQIHDGDAYLYEVVPRLSVVTASDAGGKGGRRLW